MDCPKCTGVLEPQTYGETIRLHRCSACAGLWCPPDVVAEMRKAWMSEAVLDTGDPKIGHQLDAVDDIHCPVCDSLMDKTNDEEQLHIWYESCPRGHGIFLDAGEFTDLKYETLLDPVRAFIRGPRKNR